MRLALMLLLVWSVSFTSHAQKRLDRSKSAQKVFYEKVKDQTFKEIDQSELPKKLQSRVFNNNRTGRIETAYKNGKNVYAVVLFNPKKRKVSRKIQNRYKGISKGQPKIDPNRQIVFFDEKNALDEKSFPGDMFSPKDNSVTGGMIIPGIEHVATGRLPYQPVGYD